MKKGTQEILVVLLALLGAAFALLTFIAFLSTGMGSQ
jgi:hypothetical protein